MGRIYLDITDAINKQKFEMRVPESYNPNLPSYYTEYGMPPMFEPPEGHMCVSFMAPKDVVDMCFNNVEFEIVNQIDTARIVDLLDQYLQYVEKYRASSEELEQFCQRAQKARNTLAGVVTDRRKFIERRYGLRRRATDLMEAMWRFKK